MAPCGRGRNKPRPGWGSEVEPLPSTCGALGLSPVLKDQEQERWVVARDSPEQAQGSSGCREVRSPWSGGRGEQDHTLSGGESSAGRPGRAGRWLLHRPVERGQQLHPLATGRGQILAWFGDGWEVGANTVPGLCPNSGWPWAARGPVGVESYSSRALGLRELWPGQPEGDRALGKR